jgi:hypothetical protein
MWWMSYKFRLHGLISIQLQTIHCKELGPSWTDRVNIQTKDKKVSLSKTKLFNLLNLFININQEKLLDYLTYNIINFFIYK